MAPLTTLLKFARCRNVILLEVNLTTYIMTFLAKLSHELDKFVREILLNVIPIFLQSSQQLKSICGR